MKNFLNLLFHFKFKELFVYDTDDAFIQFFRFCFVGAVATAFDVMGGLFLRLFIAEKYTLNLFFVTLGRDAVAGAFGFVIGLIVNYVISILWVFKRKDISRVKEFSVFAIIGVIGLFINTGVMEGLTVFITEQNGWLFIIKKIIATLVTMIWNFAGRKLILYRNK